MLSKITTTLLVACLLALGHAFKFNAFDKIGKAVRRVKGHTETRGRDLISSECVAVFADFYALNNSGQPCDGYPIGEFFEDLDSEYEYGPPNVTLLCVNDCLGSIGDVWSELYENNCFEEVGADDFDAEQVLDIIEYTCVMHPDGSYCYDKAVKIFDDDNVYCSDFDGLDCCYGWIKQFAACFESNEWTESTDENDPLLLQCPGAGVSTTACSGTPAEGTCGASGLSISALLSLSSLLLFILNQ